MTTSKEEDLFKGQIIDLEDQQVDPDDEGDCVEQEELDLDDESNKMLSIWTRGTLLKEAAKLKNDKSKLEYAKSVQHYDGQQKLEDMAAKMKELEGGHVFIDIIQSNPEGNKILQSSTVKVDKVGYVDGNEIPLDSTLIQGKPHLVKLSEGPIIPGLLYGLMEMREGETANIIIHPSMGFGALGCPPLIPENSYLFYNVKVHRVWHESDLEYVLGQELQLEGPELELVEKLRIVKEHKEIANQFLKDNLPREAIVRYKAAIKYLEGVDGNIVLRSPELKETIKLLYQNSTITFNKLELYRSASKYGKKCLLIDPNNAKVCYHLAKARVGLGDYERALTYIDKAILLEPTNPSLIKFRSELEQQRVDIKRKSDETLKKMAKAFC